jgi:hypothetical protein
MALILIAEYCDGGKTVQKEKVVISDENHVSLRLTYNYLSSCSKTHLIMSTQSVNNSATY